MLVLTTLVIGLASEIEVDIGIQIRYGEFWLEVMLDYMFYYFYHTCMLIQFCCASFLRSTADSINNNSDHKQQQHQNIEGVTWT